MHRPTGLREELQGVQTNLVSLLLGRRSVQQDKRRRA
jgi:hypothetical protein